MIKNTVLLNNCNIYNKHVLDIFMAGVFKKTICKGSIKRSVNLLLNISFNYGLFHMDFHIIMFTQICYAANMVQQNRIGK